jgi:hypothetical protein
MSCQRDASEFSCHAARGGNSWSNYASFSFPKSHQAVFKVPFVAIPTV